jgi:pectinesterase
MKTTLLLLLLSLANLTHGQNYRTEMTVALDGSGDFTSIQAAINATKTFPYERITIYVKNGIYKEKVEVYSWNPKVSLIGESREGTIISYDDHFKKINKDRNSTFHTYTLLVRGNDFLAKNLTIINSSGPVGQAVALHIEADRVTILNSTIKGFQDTLYVAGEGFRSYFNDVYIEGTVDFIFGEGTALFENSEIKSLRNNTYITAASTPTTSEFGLVFNHCKLTAAQNVDSVYLGRPWRENAKTVFMNSYFGKHILPEGWHNWDRPANETSTFYAEYGNTGKGSNTDNRVVWSKGLSEQQAKHYSMENIFRGWKPLK